MVVVITLVISKVVVGMVVVARAWAVTVAVAVGLAHYYRNSHRRRRPLVILLLLLLPLIRRLLLHRQAA